jgi:hypothetical protein
MNYVPLGALRRVILKNAAVLGGYKGSGNYCYIGRPLKRLIRFLFGNAVKKLWSGPLDRLLALDLVLVIRRVVHAVEALLCVGKVHIILIALLSLLLLETGIPCLIGTPLGG